MEAELEALMGEDLDCLLNDIIASNAEALEECEEMDKYLDEVKNSLEGWWFVCSLRIFIHSHDQRLQARKGNWHSFRELFHHQGL